MKLLIALALAAAPSALAMAPYVPVDEPQGPTAAPTLDPTAAPTKDPTPAPTKEPTPAPTKEPTPAPTVEKNGCGEPCLGVETLNTVPFHIESGTCYVVEGTFLAALIVPEGVECAKITVPKGSGLNTIRAHSRVFLFAPRPTKR